jgi:hypothetical protein
MKSAQEYRSLAAKAAAEALDPRYPTVLRARFGTAERAYRHHAEQADRLAISPTERVRIQVRRTSFPSKN